MHVIDLEGEEYPLQATSTNEVEVNGNQSLSATILPTKTNKKFIKNIAQLWRVVDHDEVEHVIKYLKRKGEGKLMRVDIKAIPLFFDVLDNGRIYDRYDEHMTAQRAFNLIFEDTGFTFILNGTFHAVQWEGFGDGESKLETFKRAIERYKAEFRISGNIVYLENQIGRDLQARYEHRLNASNIVQEIDGNEYWTYAKGYGDYGDGEGGEDWQNAKLVREYTSPLAKIPGIGIRHAPPIKNGNITDKDTMDEQLKTLVDESLKISVSADIHDLRKQNYPIAQSQAGDRVFLIDRRIGLDDEVRVISQSITRDWKGKVIDLKITFGSQGIAKRHQANIQAAQKAINDLIEGKRKLPFSVYEARVQEALIAMNSALTQLTVLDDGSLAAIDPDDPNYMVILNSRGLFLSEDGGATPKQAMYGGGINASVITAGSMLADRIAGGILQSLNGNTHFNLNTGKLTMANANFELGGGADIHFTDAGNRLFYRRNDWASGFGVGTSINDTYPYAHFGVVRGSKPHAMDSLDFSGFIANANDREEQDAVGNSVVGNRFHVRDNAVSFSKGFLFNINVSRPYLSPMNTGSYNYDLGSSNNRWDRFWVNRIRGPQDFEIRNYYNERSGWLIETNYSGSGAGITLRGLNGGSYNYNIGGSASQHWIKHTWSENVTSKYINSDYVNGTVVGTSTKNAKMGIEDVDGGKAFDYFDMMKIKTFYYKDSDYTNPYNRKVSPIIEQLDPVLENLYKATDEGLDINSNLFLLAKAFQYYVNKTDERLEALESGSA